MRKIIYLILGAVCMISCGQRHEAKTVVRDFIREQMKTDDYALVFGRLDSTYRISDSIMGDLQKRSTTDTLFKQPMQLGDYQGVKTKLVLTAKIIMKDDTLKRTFYLDPNLKAKRILAIKEN